MTARREVIGGRLGDVELERDVDAHIVDTLAAKRRLGA